MLESFKKKGPTGEIVLQMSDSPVVLAFWTCLQLERYLIYSWQCWQNYFLLINDSDILAELDLPPSNISRYENQVPPYQPIPFPNQDDPEFQMWVYYNSQLYLRKLLNQVHSSLYDEQ